MSDLSHTFYSTCIRRFTNVRLPSRQNLLGKLGFYATLYLFRLGYAIYYKMKGRKETRRGGGVIISTKHKFVFYLVPKVATRSFLNYFVYNPNEDWDTFYVPRSKSHLAADTQELKQYYKFAFVRNPWARVVSCYKDKVCNVNKISKITILAKYSGLKPDMPFADFVRWLCSAEGQDRFADRHWKSQHEILADDSGKISLDYIGKLETIEEDLEKICNQVAVPKFTIPRKNTSKNITESSENSNKSRGYREFYTAETQELIAQRYKEDIEKFAYTF